MMTGVKTTIELEILIDPFFGVTDNRELVRLIAQGFWDEAIYLEVEAVGSVSKVIPAKLSGPPDMCYPEEGGEVEIEHLRCLTDGYKDMTAEQIEWLMSPADFERVTEALAETAQDDDSYGGRDPDAAYDQMRDDAMDARGDSYWGDASDDLY